MVWRKLTREDLEQTKKHFAESGYVVQWFAMAQDVILTTLGPGWWKANCLTNSEKPDPFLNLKVSYETDPYNFQDRIIRLGHMLYNLTECIGYGDFISSLRSRDLESAFFEIQVAHLTKNSGHQVQFVKPSGQRGSDYDLIATINTTPVYIEAKSRRSGVVMSEKALKKKLDKARKQLPLTGPGIIFVSIPEEWTEQKDAEAIISRSIASFFRNSARVNHVILIWHQWIDTPKGRASVTRVRQYNNPSPRYPFAMNPVINTIEGPIELEPNKQPFRPSFW